MPHPKLKSPELNEAHDNMTEQDQKLMALINHTLVMVVEHSSSKEVCKMFHTLLQSYATEVLAHLEKFEEQAKP